MNPYLKENKKGQFMALGQFKSDMLSQVFV